MDNNVPNQTNQNLDGVSIPPISNTPPPNHTPIGQPIAPVSAPAPVNQSAPIQDMAIDGSAVHNDLPPSPLSNQPVSGGVTPPTPLTTPTQALPPTPPKKSSAVLWIIIFIILLAILSLGYMYIYDIGFFSKTSVPVTPTAPLVEKKITTSPISITTTPLNFSTSTTTTRATTSTTMVTR